MISSGRLSDKKRPICGWCGKRHGYSCESSISNDDYSRNRSEVNRSINKLRSDDESRNKESGI